MIKDKIRPLLEPAAWALLAAALLRVMGGAINLLTSESNVGQVVPFVVRAVQERDTFLSVESTALPVLSVLLATQVGRPLDRARHITLVATAAEGLALLLGVITWVSALGVPGTTGFAKLRMFLTAGAYLAVLVLALLFSLTVLRSANLHPTIDPFAPRDPAPTQPPAARFPHAYGQQWYGQQPGGQPPFAQTWPGAQRPPSAQEPPGYLPGQVPEQQPPGQWQGHQHPHGHSGAEQPHAQHEQPGFGPPGQGRRPSDQAYGHPPHDHPYGSELYDQGDYQQGAYDQRSNPQQPAAPPPSTWQDPPQPPR